MTLDEVWSEYEQACRERDDVDERAWRPIRAYVADAKEGTYSDTVPPAQTIHAVFAALTEESDQLALCAHIDQRVRAGANPRKDTVTDAPALASTITLLQADHARYQADVRASDIWTANVPGEKGRGRLVPLIVLREPTATHAVRWACTDRTTPGGTGYGLVLVERGGQLAIVANPGAKLDLTWLAKELDGLERSRRLPALANPEADSPHWRHEGASIDPPSDDSVVPFGELYNAIAVRLLLKRPVTIKQQLGLFATALVLVLVGAAIVGFAFLRRL